MPQNTAIRALLTATILLGGAMLPAACSGGHASSGPQRDSSGSLAQRGGEEDSDFGLGGDESLVQPDSPGGSSSKHTGADKASKAAAKSAADAPWSIVLRTFSQDDHAVRAAASLNDVRALSPLVSTARVEQIAGGSAIVVGRYGNPSDADAQRDLKRLKALAVRTSRPFAQAMLTRIGPLARTAAQFDLSQLRQKYPKVDPLYTLQVAVWGSFDSGTISIDEVRRRAEEYCAKLRGQGFEAYVHHSDATGLSKVTVGAFDRTAFDANSGLPSPELEAIMRQFPTHLVNGEPVQEANVAKLPKKYGYHTQKPHLVEVPK